VSWDSPRMSSEQEWILISSQFMTTSNQNDINESTRMQLDAISLALAELQSSRSQNATLKPRKPIGFIQPEEKDED